jgi:cytochrome c oxidase subunit I+III
LLLAAWALTVMARRWNKRGHALAFYTALSGGVVFSAGGAVALIAGPWRSGLDPAAHVYPAIVWALVLWTVIHAAVGIIMQLYCVARRIAGRMSAEHDIDIANVTLFWHFVATMTAITVAIIAFFPLVK